ATAPATRSTSPSPWANQAPRSPIRRPRRTSPRANGTARRSPTTASRSACVEQVSPRAAAGGGRLPSAALAAQPPPAVDPREHQLAAPAAAPRRRAAAQGADGAAARVRRGRTPAVLPLESAGEQRAPRGAAARLGGECGFDVHPLARAAPVRGALRGAAPQPARSRRDPPSQPRPVPLLPPAGGDRRDARPAAALRGRAARAGRFLTRRQLHAAGRGGGARGGVAPRARDRSLPGARAERDARGTAAGHARL